MNNYDEALKLSNVDPSEWAAPVLLKANVLATLALVDELREARKPVEVKVDVPAATAARDFNFLPGDVVRMSIKSDLHSEYDERHGVVTYGPDNEGGWLVSSAPGEIRCVASELTMLTRREDRKQ